MSRRMLVIALGALIVSACSTSREATEVSSFRGQDSRMLKDSVKVEKVVVEVHDTIMETTTITVDRNEIGDTLKVAQVTERDRIKNRDRVLDNHEKVVIRTDTVFIEKRNSVLVKTNTDHTNRTEKGATIVTSLKWVFWIIVAVIALIIVIKVSKVFKII